MRALQAIAILALLVVAAFAQSRTTGFQSVVQELAQFQTKSGGFTFSPQLPPSLQATAQALFLSSVFGLRDKIDTSAAAHFVESLATAQGYSNVAGQTSDIQSVRNALLSAGYLGVAPADKNALEGYIRSLWDAESRLFAPKAGAKPTVRATAEALESLSLLSALTRDPVSKIVSEVKSLLTESLLDTEEGTKSFAFVNGPTGDKDAYEANVYGIIAGSYAGYKFDKPQAWAKYFSVRQAAAGGVSVVFGTRPSLESTFQAVAALAALERVSGYDIATTLADESLLQFIYNIPHDLHAGFMTHYVLAHTSSFQKVFATEIGYDTATGPIDASTTTIVQGASISPVVRALPFNQPHSGLSIEVVLTHESSAARKFKLQWNAERYAYTTEETFDTASKLGELSVVANIGIQVVGETVGFALADSKQIGYNIRINPTAKVAGKELKPGETVTVGTEFSFDVELASANGPITSGAFEVLFDVVDSSDVVISRTKKDCTKSAQGLVFNYDLSAAKLPAGIIGFRFQIKDTVSGIVHSEQRIGYQLALTMVATQITFASASGNLKPSYQLGQTAVVSIIPASLPDLVTLHTYDAVDASGADTTTPAAGSASTHYRTFFLDSYSGDVLLHSFPGVVSKDYSGQVKVTFDVVFPATFDSIGSHEIKFRYHPRFGKDITMGNYDSAASDFYDEVTPIGFTVVADLELTELEDAPKGGKLSYGNDISFSFQVVDKLSKKSVQSTVGAPAVFLTLTNTDSKGKSFVSARDAAQATEAGFSVDWIVNPNAVKGKGKLSLVAEVIGDEQIVLKTADGKVFSVDVEVGGDISHTATVRQIATPEGSHGAALVEFSLTCQQKPLSGAQLVAIVSREGKNILTLPVARNDDVGTYSASWSLTEAEAISGQYNVAILREVDAKNASPQPLFTIPVAFVGSTAHILPFRTEAVILTLALASFGVFSYRKWLIERKN